MPLHNHFDVANLVGHPAFEHLSVAIHLYDHAKQKNLLDPTLHSWPECLGLGLELEILRKAELKHCVQVVILFQTMMEKVPYFIPSIGTKITPTNKKGFYSSWTDVISQIKNSNSRTKAKNALNSYKNNFYDALRNPIIHCRNASDIAEVNKIRAPIVYEGMCKGWEAYDYLLTEAFAPQQTHEPSWANMCKTHTIPDTLNSSNFPNLDDMQTQFNLKHFNGARNNNN